MPCLWHLFRRKKLFVDLEDNLSEQFSCKFDGHLVVFEYEAEIPYPPDRLQLLCSVCFYEWCRP